MDYTKLGHTGLDVSRICLGCMTYGVPDRGTNTDRVIVDPVSALATKHGVPRAQIALADATEVVHHCANCRRVEAAPSRGRRCVAGAYAFARKGGISR